MPATPGPWEVAKGGRSVNAGRFGKIRMEAGVPPDELAATMRLVAAAPELLAACKAVSHAAQHGLPLPTAAAALVEAALHKADCEVAAL